MADREFFTPSHTYEEALERAARLWGVEPEYYDIWGSAHRISQEATTAILRSLGACPDSLDDLNRCMEDVAWRHWSAVLPPTSVVSVKAAYITFHIPQAFLSGSVTAKYLWESGTSEDMVAQTSGLHEEAEAELRGQVFVRKHLSIPPGRPLGYHSVQIELRGENGISARCTAQLIICPDRAYYPDKLSDGKRAAGLAVSLYGLRSGRNWGCGDFTDLYSLTDWVAKDLGGGFISLNPLHAIPNRQPYNTSPYLPVNSFYRNPIYLDIEQMPDFQTSPWAGRMLQSGRVQSLLQELRASRYVEYEKVWDLKLHFLRLCFRAFSSELRERTPRAQEFEQWAAKEGDLLDTYALYSALEESLHKQDRNVWIWPQWPGHYQRPDTPETRQFASDHPRLILFYKYLQWQVDQQLAAAQKYTKTACMPIGLYHDLALATDRCGSDLWAHGEFYIHGCRVGSPPDAFSPKGQDWAFPPPNSIRHQQDGYRLLVQSIRKNCRHGGALRIDHVMRFFRLYWIPDGFDALQGTYVRERFEDLLRILALESVRQEVIIVGEDLGTVEPFVREALQRFGILSYRLLYFERNPNGEFRLPDEYPRQALISVSTHDLPTLAGFWINRDIEARRNAGLLPDDANYLEQLANRARDKQKLLNLFFRLNLLPSFVSKLAFEIPEFTGELHNAAIGFLAMSPAELMCLNQEDLTKELDQQNLPGSTEQYPNWRHKMQYTLDELRTDATAAGCTSMFRDWLSRTGRLNSQ